MTHEEHSPPEAPEGDPADEKPIDASASPRHAKKRDVVWVEPIQGRYVVADISDFRQFELTGPSAEVWSRLDGFASDDEVVRAVLATYPEHPDTAYAECISFIEKMAGLGLLIRQPDTVHGVPDTDLPDRGSDIVQPAQKGTVE